ncbi:hypothetical protein A2781_02220 [Candidatus Gottesmanbacteria bacterium RIFCSPHIGHO2_01_FULL_42_27]|uniref:Transcobalamin-like C-terminal domain-containing protein n=2 Tax=Candidatus Gottesmaniibacteriota TaxID=1752720 RepID=A0A1F6BK18_9BACT|nr:MAG: hypothetical protein UV09_C0012G0067 [Candidatus Gottesmanbacteria bacterium GW2011_GWA2_42_18]KKS76318.1 MAG: hypothetical protein UV46_C0004G0004 [Candidatus Gottesmanbacteria bacterium GW2011_GWC2_42_8]OGG09099.1 MAG: hypothetical protein A2781_02220 [Candidatus Gottesmanbacteria bacterium RIFCSPHIGHO2_01_FULL_42_27]OGG35206.1 MAG: hypothetical protein A3G68_05915 [Candidatus Gottesmanbacteria bacterium RIFCSPLOWO2_12_FULL_42_10]OGG37112.1 MAG: hypothetical protein A2968_01550 [Candi
MPVSKRKNNRNLIILVILLLLGSVFFGQTVFLKEDKKTEEKETISRSENTVDELIQEREATGNKITVNFGAGKTFVKDLQAATPYEALKTMASQEGWEIKTKEYKYGLMVEGVGNLINSDKGYWTYKTNGQPGKIASDRYTLKKGETVEWEYVQVD